MLKIKGEFIHIKRVKLPPPEDGVHVAGKNGHIKGVHSVWLGDMLIPKGSTGFYYRLNDDRGIKVLYSLSWYTPIKERLVKEEYRRLKKMSKLGVAPATHGLYKVKLDCRWQGKKVRGAAWAIEMDHIHYHYESWKAYAQGYPYDFGAVDEENHNPESFLAARKVIMAKFKEAHIKSDSSLKIGDLIYCMKRKLWLCCDTM